MTDLDWKPEYGLVEGLADSYQKDFGRGTMRKEADFTTDDVSVLFGHTCILASQSQTAHTSVACLAHLQRQTMDCAHTLMDLSPLFHTQMILSKLKK